VERGDGAAYLRAMSWFPRPSSPSAAFADLRAFMRQRSREQKIGAALSLLVTAIIVIVFFADSKINTAPPPYIVYVENWPSSRTEAEIVAQQKKDHAALEAARREKQKQFQELENKFGM
jgi:flagellar biosynthesis/type III secretory pathway M-ring protein FliF/YscJ